MIDLKIRNATKDQFVTVADMARTNMGAIERRGLRNGMALVRGDISVYLYLTDSGKSVVAYVSQEEAQNDG